MIGEPSPSGPADRAGEPGIVAAAPLQDQPAAAPAATSAPAEPAQLRSMLELLGSVVAPTTLLTAILYYFGFMSTNALAQHLGLDANILGYSTPDYVLRSIEPVVPALGFLLLVVLVSMRLHGRLLGWVDSQRHLEVVDRLARATIVVGMILLVTAILAFLGVFDTLFKGSAETWIDDNLILVPLSVLLGVVGAAYGTHIRRVWLSSSTSMDGSQREPRWVRSVKLAAIFMLIGVNVFWAAGEWAIKTGEQKAEALISSFSSLPHAVVHSREDLGIDPTGGIAVDRLGGADNGYRFRYGGLRYLTRSAGKYVLLSDCWATGRGRTIVLTDAGNLWVEVTAPSETVPPARCP